MRLTRTILGFAAAASLTLTSAYADQRHPSGAKPTTIHEQSTGDHSTTQQTTNSPTKSSSTKSSSSKPTTHTSGSKSPSKTQLNPIAAKISAKPNLNAKITAMLPKGTSGHTMSLNTASKGFKNQGQFIAALHASQRLDCGTASCFTQLKADMVDKHMSLGQSIQDVKHTSSTTATSEATRAEHEAEHDLADHDEHHDTRHHEESEHHDRDSHHDGGHGKFVKQIERNKQLDAKVTALLPANMTLKKAAKGFSSETQFLAALHAAKDLNIPFAQLKAEMTGHDHDSLTQAIRELKPTTDARAAVKTALQEARTDIRTTTTQPANAGH